MPTTRSSGVRRKEPTPRSEVPAKRSRKAAAKGKKEDPVKEQEVTEEVKPTPFAEEQVVNGQTNDDAHKENGVAVEEKQEQPVQEEKEPSKEEEPVKEQEEEEKEVKKPKAEETPKEEVTEEKENEPEVPAEVEAETTNAAAQTKGRRGRKPKKVSVEH